MRKWNNFLSIILLFFVLISCEEILLEEDLNEITIQTMVPSHNAFIETNSVNFSWQHDRVYDTIQYRLQIAKPDFDSPQSIIDTIIEETHHSQSLNDGIYEWRVRAENNATFSEYSQSMSFRVQTVDLSQVAVVLDSPLESYVTNVSPVVFSWEDIDEAMLYRFELLKENQLFYQATTDQNEISVQFFDDVDGNYIWRVRAEDAFSHSAYSERTFLLDRLSPNIPQLETPQNNSEHSQGEQVFEWQRASVIGSNEFDSIYIASNIDFSQDLIKSRSVSFSKTIELTSSGMYFWKVKSFDEAGNVSMDSEVFQFMIQ